MSLKNPATPPGIDPRTVRLVAQHLNHYATPGPKPLTGTGETVPEHRLTRDFSTKYIWYRLLPLRNYSERGEFQAPFKYYPRCKKDGLATTKLQLKQKTTATAIDHDRQMLKTLFATVFAVRTRCYIRLPSQSIWLLSAPLKVTNKKDFRSEFRIKVIIF